MLTKEQLSTLYRESLEAKQRTAYARTLANPVWETGITSTWLYRLACEVAGVASMRDDEIIPTVFGPDWLESARKVVRSEYWFWVVTHRWSIVQPGNADLLPAEMAIREVRNHNARINIDRLKALGGGLTVAEACLLTHVGVILCDHNAGPGGKGFVINPLYFYDRELEAFDASR